MPVRDTVLRAVETSRTLALATHAQGTQADELGDGHGVEISRQSGTMPPGDSKATPAASSRSGVLSLTEPQTNHHHQKPSHCFRRGFRDILMKCRHKSSLWVELGVITHSPDPTAGRANTSANPPPNRRPQGLAHWLAWLSGPELRTGPGTQ